jgi:N-acetylglucosamine-6-phosphate deacetylase
MNPLHHRAPGVPGTALADERLHVGVIADGVHVDPVVVRLAHRLLHDRFVLVTDAVAPMGTPGAAGKGVRLADGTLAGADLAMNDAVANLAAYTGAGLGAAVSSASSAPAAAIGAGERGHLRPGARGDVVVLRPDGTVEATVISGTSVPRPISLL